MEKLIVSVELEGDVRSHFLEILEFLGDKNLESGIRFCIKRTHKIIQNYKSLEKSTGIIKDSS